MAPAQGLHAQIEKCKQFFLRIVATLVVRERESPTLRLENHRQRISRLEHVAQFALDTPLFSENPHAHAASGLNCNQRQAKMVSASKGPPAQIQLHYGQLALHSMVQIKRSCARSTRRCGNMTVQ